MATKPPDPKERRTCIFCGASGMTKEHVWPDWLSQIFVPDSGATHTFGTTDPSLIWGLPKTTELDRPGHPGTYTVKAVCRSCNNEWLSRLESKAQPILVPLAIGEELNLTPELQQTLAVWLAKTAMIAERLKRRQNGITSQERVFLKENLLPPPNWIIWIAANSGGRWSDFGMGQHRGEISDSPIPHPKKPARYVQVSTFGLGYSVFFVLSTNWEEAPNAFSKIDGEGRFQIWPPLQRSILWPPFEILDDEQINYMANILTQSGILNQSYNALGNWKFEM